MSDKIKFQKAPGHTFFKDLLYKDFFIKLSGNDEHLCIKLDWNSYFNITEAELSSALDKMHVFPVEHIVVYRK